MRGKSLKFGIFTRTAFASLALGLAVSACAPNLEEDTVTAECSLPADQKNTLSGRWRSYPVYISFRDGQFNAYELNLIMDAADRWNHFFSAAHGIQILDYGSRSHPRMTTREKP